MMYTVYKRAKPFGVGPNSLTEYHSGDFHPAHVTIDRNTTPEAADEYAQRPEVEDGDVFALMWPTGFRLYRAVKQFSAVPE
jgi:hypothetical protein